MEKGEEAVLSIRNFGEKSFHELQLRMVEKGYLSDDSQEEAELE
jgi:DNA-directed RNA polymerase subunit alpha